MSTPVAARRAAFQPARVERLSALGLAVMAAALLGAHAVARTGLDTVLRLGLHPLETAVVAAGLLGGATWLLLPRPWRLAGGVALALGLVACTVVATGETDRGGSASETTDSGRHTVVATADGPGARFWLEENDGLLVRRVPLGCTSGSGWGVTAGDDVVRILVNPAFDEGSQRSQIVDVDAAMRTGGWTTGCS